MTMKHTDKESYNVICSNTYKVKMSRMLDEDGKDMFGKDHKWHATCDELGVSSSGRTRKEAKEALEHLILQDDLLDGEMEESRPDPKMVWKKKIKK